MLLLGQCLQSTLRAVLAALAGAEMALGCLAGHGLAISLKSGRMLKGFCNQQNTCQMKVELVFSELQYLKLEFRGLLLF